MKHKTIVLSNGKKYEMTIPETRKDMQMLREKAFEAEMADFNNPNGYTAQMAARHKDSCEGEQDR